MPTTTDPLDTLILALFLGGTVLYGIWSGRANMLTFRLLNSLGS